MPGRPAERELTVDEEIASGGARPLGRREGPWLRLHDEYETARAGRSVQQALEVLVVGEHGQEVRPPRDEVAECGARRGLVAPREREERGGDLGHRALGLDRAQLLQDRDRPG